MISGRSKHLASHTGKGTTLVAPSIGPLEAALAAAGDPGILAEAPRLVSRFMVSRFMVSWFMVSWFMVSRFMVSRFMVSRFII